MKLNCVLYVSLTPMSSGKANRRNRVLQTSSKCALLSQEARALPLSLLHPQMRLNTEEEEECKRGEPLTVATPRLRSRPFSLQLISARGAQLRIFLGVHLEVEYGGRRGTPLSPRGERKRRERKEGSAGLAPGPPTLAPEACRARASRALATLSRALPGQLGRSPHTRGGAAAAARHEPPS